MSAVIAWMAAAAEGTGSGDIAPLTTHPSTSSGQAFSQKQREVGSQVFSQEAREVGQSVEFLPQGLPAHSFPPRQAAEPDPLGDPYQEQERRVYRGRTVAMLRRYMKYSMETGRLPSLLGEEFFRARVTAYTVVTFEDRVIFVHDMETCLDRLDEFSRQLIARHIMQEHDRCATARLLHCNEKTVRRWTPLALDQLSEILLEVGLMERLANDGKFLSRGFRP
jgi:hypothetical protein